MQVGEKARDSWAGLDRYFRGKTGMLEYVDE